MITNPHAGTPSEPGWAMGFAFGFMGPDVSSPPPGVIAPDLLDAFAEGQLAGQQAAVDGISLSNDCMDAFREPSASAEAVVKGAHVLEAAGIIADFAEGGDLVGTALSVTTGVGAGFAGLVVLLFTLSIPSGPPALTPEDVLPDLGQKFVDALNNLGIDSGELFIAVGFDKQVKGCELKFSSLFKTIDQARQAADDMGRPHRAIAHWLLNASGSVEIVEAS